MYRQLKEIKVLPLFVLFCFVSRSKRTPTCPAEQTCTIDENCKAPDGTNFCVKDIWIKECPDGQAVCKLFNGSTGCSTCCDGIPDCIDQSDESPCNKYKCQARWRLVYEHDASGKAIFGSKTELKKAVGQGAEVKIFYGDAYVDTPETTIIVGDEVCGQHIFSISKASWSTFQTKVYWWFTVLCTTGDFSMSRWNVGSHTSRTNSQSTSVMKWFIREIPDKPIVTIPTTGHNLNALIHAVRESGYGVTVKHKPLNEPSGNWEFKHFASDGSVEFSNYLVGENKRVGIDTGSQRSSDWYFDPCWELIYANRANDSSTDGSIQGLIDAVRAGNRVKVMINDRISKASVVLINGGIVTALLPNLLKKSNIYTLEDPGVAGAKWEWMLVNTNGKVETATYHVGKSSGSIASSTADIKWFVDRRHWQMILDVGPKSYVNSGSKTQLAKEIRNGADVRFAWVSKNAVYTVLEADNIGFDGTTENFGAMHVRSLLLTSVGNEYKFDISAGTLTWFFTITENSGTVMSTKWEAGENVSRGVGSTNNRVVWWIAN